MKTIGVLTSTATSMEHAEKSIRSVHNQVDLIRWHLPMKSVRQEKVYGKVPDWVSNYPRLQVIRCTDDGPATKVTPLLDDKSVDPMDQIVIFDDDLVYPTDAVHVLSQAKSQEPNCIVGFAGHSNLYIPFQYKRRYARGPADGKLHWYNRVRILMGTRMILTQRDALPDNRQMWLDKMNEDERYFLNDDHLLAHWAWMKGKHMYLVRSSTPMEEEMAEDGDENRLAGTNSTGTTETHMMWVGDLPWPRIEIALCSVGLALIVTSLLLVYFYMLK